MNRLTSWDDVQNLSLVLSWKIVAHNKKDLHRLRILGVPRSGLIPAVLISHVLNIEMVEK